MIQAHDPLASVAKPPQLVNGDGGANNTDARTLRDICFELRDRVDAFLDQKASSPLLAQVQDQLRISLRVVEDALKRYEHEQLAISYNGGKDWFALPDLDILSRILTDFAYILVLLIVVLACLGRHFSSTVAADPTSQAPNSLQAVYIVAPNSFPQVDEFTESSAREYRLDLCRFALPMRAALDAYLGERPAVRAIFVGTRRTDPHGAELKHFDPTSAGWPDFMRIHPVIDWHYAEIWAFIRQLDIPYCSLYDQGYTSLGGTTDTHPNPQLATDGKNGAFRPAYELVDDDEERLGRDA